MGDDEMILLGIDIKRSFDKLTAKHRAIVALRMAGYTQRECGEIVGLTRAAVGISYKKAKTIIREGISDGVA